MERSPQQWLTELDQRLHQRQPRYARLAGYASGDHPLPQASEKWREIYRRWQRQARTNYCRVAADAVSDRLRVEGFSAGGGDLDEVVWSWWQAAHMDADSDLVHATAAQLSDAYVMVGVDATGRPVITPEHPTQVITDTDPLDRRRVRAGLKTWVDGDTAHARLHLPGWVIPYTSPITPVWVEGVQQIEKTPRAWTPAGDPQPTGIARVPIVRFVNRPQIGGEGLAEFEDATDVQDRINSITLHLLTVSAAQAFRQRIVKGLATEDEAGNPVDPPFEALVSDLWMVEDTDVQFQELDAVDLRPSLELRRDAVTAFIVTVGLPAHYVSGDIVNVSADTILASDTRLVSRVVAQQRAHDDPWEDVVSLAAEYADVTLPPDTEVLWADPERKSTAAIADAALKASQIGLPFEWVARMMRYSPQQIQLMQKARRDDTQLRIDAVADAEQAMTVGGDVGGDVTAP